jgi:hypothetical protein
MYKFLSIMLVLVSATYSAVQASDNIITVVPRGPNGGTVACAVTDPNTGLTSFIYVSAASCKRMGGDATVIRSDSSKLITK